MTLAADLNRGLRRIPSRIQQCVDDICSWPLLPGRYDVVPPRPMTPLAPNPRLHPRQIRSWLHVRAVAAKAALNG